MTDPIPTKALNDIDRQAAKAQMGGKPFKPSPYLVRCIITELKAYRAKASKRARSTRGKLRQERKEYQRVQQLISNNGDTA